MPQRSGKWKLFTSSTIHPTNAVLAVAGDVNPAEVFAKAEKYFGSISPRRMPPRVDTGEAPQTAERSFVQTDKLANVPALAIGYRMPARGSRDAIVAAVTGELLHNGQASRLYQALVKEKQTAVSVDGGVNWPLGNPFEYNGPTLMTSFIVAPPNAKEQTLVADFDRVVADLAEHGPSTADLERIRAKMRSDWYDQLEVPMNRASTLSHAVLFDGNADIVSRGPVEIASVTAQDVQNFAKKYLVKTNRTLIWRVPEPKQP